MPSSIPNNPKSIRTMPALYPRIAAIMKNNAKKISTFDTTRR